MHHVGALEPLGKKPCTAKGSRYRWLRVGGFIGLGASSLEANSAFELSVQGRAWGAYCLEFGGLGFRVLRP